MITFNRHTVSVLSRSKLQNPSDTELIPHVERPVSHDMTDMVPTLQRLSVW